MLAENLQPGDIVTSLGDEIVQPITDHGSYIAAVVRASNGVVHVRTWDRGTDVKLHRLYSVEYGPQRVGWQAVVTYFGGEDAARVAYEGDHIIDHYTREDI